MSYQYENCIFINFVLRFVCFDFVDMSFRSVLTEARIINFIISAFGKFAIFFHKNFARYICIFLVLYFCSTKAKIMKFIIFAFSSRCTNAVYFPMHFFIGSQTVLVNLIQGNIQTAYSTIPQSKQGPTKATKDKPKSFSKKDMLHFEQNFNSLLSTIVLFLEHDPFTNIAMNLDVNYRRVKQENFEAKRNTEEDIQKSIQKVNGDDFQNSPIHLLFYEKVNKRDKSDNALLFARQNYPELSSLSWCKLNNIHQPNLDNLAYTMEVQFILQDCSAQFVTRNQYHKLLFVLGQNPDDALGQNCKDVLTLFNEFPTNTVHNFKDMLHRFDFPYVYNNQKTLAENRGDFQDFFSCLTNIRCAVVEGSHRCEAASRTLRGYHLRDPIPLEHRDEEIDIPANSTLFREIQTQIYYPPNNALKLDNEVLDFLRSKSQDVAHKKKLVVDLTWHNFFENVLADINGHQQLQQVLYNSEAEFFAEEVHHREFSKDTVRSNQIKKYLHEILTNAIFNYPPCTELLKVLDENSVPTVETWGQVNKKWLSLSVEPFQNVSTLSCIKFAIKELHSIILLFRY